MLKTFMLKSRASCHVYLIGVPIGNYADITFRAVETFKKVDLILCEDTRETQLLMNEFLLTKDLISYIGSYDSTIKKSLHLLNGGKSIAIVSDRGMPCISDPGASLVNFFRSFGYQIKIIPGVSSLTTAFCLTGLKGGFDFLGFLPRKEKEIINIINQRINLNSNIMFFESSNRIKKTLTLISKIISHKIYILRELTKTYEEILFATPNELSKMDFKGELVIIIPFNS